MLNKALKRFSMLAKRIISILRASFLGLKFILSFRSINIRLLLSLLSYTLKFYIKTRLHHGHILPWPAVTVDTYVKLGSFWYLIRKFSDDLLHANPYFEDRIKNIIRRVLHKGDVFIDVGANIGSHTLYATKLIGPSGLAIAIEPVPENVKALQINCKLNRVNNLIIFPYAAYDKSNVRLDMYFNRLFTGWSSIARKQGFGSQLIKISVNTIRLDDILKKLNINYIKLIKIDVEGSELQVLNGALSTLKRTKYVLLEATYNRNILIDFMRKQGFKCIEFLCEERRHIFCINKKLML